MEYIVYLLTFDNGMCYIGCTGDYENRIKQHRRSMRGGYHDNRKIQLDYDNNIIEDFIGSILKTFNDESEAFLFEKKAIEMYAAKERGYNLSDGGHGNSGFRQSDYAKQVASETHSGKFGELNSFFGREHSDETKRKISKALQGNRKGVPKSREQREKMRKNNARSKPVSVDGVIYHSMMHAEEVTGISRKKISQLAKDPEIKNIFYVER